MSTFVKSIDSRHLLSVGSEGFFGRSSYQGYQDIVGSWALTTGVDWLRNSAGANIDFGTTHIYTGERVVAVVTSMIYAACFIFLVLFTIASSVPKSTKF
jgi:endo-1,4-beta-mannosidase